MAETKEQKIVKTFAFDESGNEYTVDAVSLNGHTYTDISEQINAVNVKDVIEEGFTVQVGSGQTVGGFKTGDTISDNTPVINIIKQLLQKQIPPTYKAPTASISLSPSDTPKSYEYGTNVTLKLVAGFTKNNGGSLKNVNNTDNPFAMFIMENGSNIANFDASATKFETEINRTLTAETKFKASAHYAQGPILQDNLGNDYETGRIQEGSVDSSELKITVYRPGYFWGILDTDSSTPITSAIIRSGTRKNGAYASGDSIGTKDNPVIKASSVANRKRIFVACPTGKTGVKKVTMPSSLDADCTSEFKKLATTVAVEGATSGSATQTYNVWVYEPAKISDEATFVVTLG